MKNAKLLLLTVVLLLTLTGCRTRTTVPVDPIPDENGEAAEDQLGQAEQIEDAEDDPAAEEDVRPDADAPTATETVPADQAENTGADESGQTAETALLYYQTLLEDRLSGLFECQRFYIYWETAEDYHTVHKSSDEHQIILNAGAYDVSAKLQNDALIVDDGWIQRKDPGVIVKVVERSVLGSGVSSTRQAETVCGALKAREGWSGLDAVRNGRVILLSEELLSGQARRTGAAVLLAKAMYPSLFSDTDGGEALRALTQEAYGAPASGTFIYVG